MAKTRARVKSRASERRGGGKGQAAGPKLPVFIVTRNGKEIQRIIPPPIANDIHWAWGPNGGGGGYFTLNGIPIPGAFFVFPPGANDWHFSLDGTTGKPLIPPPWANDVELEWERGRIVRGWWTRDGQRMEPIRMSRNVQTFSICTIDSSEADDLFGDDSPAENLKELRAMLAAKSAAASAADLRLLGQQLVRDAAVWKRIKGGDAQAVADTFLDLAFAQFGLWKIGADMRVVLSRAIGERFGSSGEIAAAAFFPSSARPQLFAGRALYDWNDKVTALANIIEELTGIPVDLLREFFAAELFELATLLKLLARLAKDKNSPEYKRAKTLLMELLEKIFNRIIGKKFREWLIKKLGKEAAEKLIEKFAEKLIPMIGWALVGIEFIALMWIWWEILLDP